MTGKQTDRNERSDPEVNTQRRRFSAEEKLQILAKADAYTQRGESGALTRLLRQYLEAYRGCCRQERSYIASE